MDYGSFLVSILAVTSLTSSLSRPCLGCLYIKLPHWFKFIEIMKTFSLCSKRMRKIQATKCDDLRLRLSISRALCLPIHYSTLDGRNQYTMVIHRVCYAQRPILLISIGDLPFKLTEEDSSRGSSFVVSPPQLFECVHYKYAASNFKSIL